MKQAEIHEQLRYINWRIHKLLTGTRDELSEECRARMADLSVSICRILPPPFERED